MNEQEIVNAINYRRYGTNALLNMMMKLQKDSELYWTILLILRSRNCNKEYFSKESKLELEKEKKRRLEVNKIHFGTKSEEYSTEKEMITGYITPKYSDLSPEEKKLYNYDDEKTYPKNYFNE